jgi:hypothetical protein
METIVVKVKSERAAQMLAHSSITKGNYTASEKPSDFAGIWNKRAKKTDAQKMCKKAWERKIHLKK